MIFDCHELLFDGGKCEWKVIRGFATRYNQDNNTDYRRLECLDVVNRSTSQPEVLLTCEGGPDMVIERKTVCWPADYIRGHKGFHRLCKELSSRFSGRFRGSPGAIVFNESALSRVRDWSNTITELCSQIEAGKFQGSKPFPWRIMTAAELGYIHGEVDGLGVEMISDSDLSFMDDPAQYGKARRTALEGFAQACRKALKKASVKFSNYPNCLRVVLLQFLGDNSCLFDEDIERLVLECVRPEYCDELWVACREFINESNYRVGWKRMWRSKVT